MHIYPQKTKKADFSITVCNYHYIAKLYVHSKGMHASLLTATTAELLNLERQAII